MDDMQYDDMQYEEAQDTQDLQYEDAQYEVAQDSQGSQGDSRSVLVAILVILLVIVLALMIAAPIQSLAAVAALKGLRRASQGRAAEEAAAEGAAEEAAAEGAVQGGGPEARSPHGAHHHPTGRAIADAALAAFNAHYEKRGGSAQGGGGGLSTPGKFEAKRLSEARQKLAAARRKAEKVREWTSYRTWEELEQDEAALAAFYVERERILNRPDLDWGPVLAQMRPRLSDDREWVGLINLDRDGRTLRVEATEASTAKVGDKSSEGRMSFAYVPAELVRKYSDRPALFLFHTHVQHPDSSPLPSSHDLAASIYLGGISRFVANVIVSSYGVLMYGPDWPAYEAIAAARDPQLATLHLTHDVVASHEAMRSWVEYSLDDYRAYYRRHKLLFIDYPSSEMTADTRERFHWDLEAEIDHGFILAQHDEIKNRHKARSKGAGLGARGKASLRSLLPELSAGALSAGTLSADTGPTIEEIVEE